MEQAISDFFIAGSVVECGCAPTVVNPLSVSIQANGKKRFILDLRYPNQLFRNPTLRYPPSLFWGIFNQRMKAKFATSGHHINTKTIFCDLKPEKKQWRFNCYPPAVSVKLIINLVLGRDFHFSLLVLEILNKGKYHSPMSKKMHKR